MPTLDSQSCKDLKSPSSDQNLEEVPPKQQVRVGSGQFESSPVQCRSEVLSRVDSEPNENEASQSSQALVAVGPSVLQNKAQVRLDKSHRVHCVTRISVLGVCVCVECIHGHTCEGGGRADRGGGVGGEAVVRVVWRVDLRKHTEKQSSKWTEDGQQCYYTVMTLLLHCYDTVITQS